MRNFWIFVLQIILLFLHCTEPHNSKVVASPKSGGIFRIVQTGEVETVDPMRIIFMADWRLASHIYEGLVGIDSAMNIQPLLAEHWQVLDGGRRLQFTLRQDAYFHDDPCFPDNRGRRVTAEDVLYTFERLAANSDICPNRHLFTGKITGLDDFQNDRADSISGIRILDKRLVEFRLTNSFTTFLKILASPTAFIVPREAVEYYGEGFSHHPVGTGPFRLVRWRPFEEIQLARHEHYWQREKGVQLPYLDAVNIRFSSNASLAFSEFLKGESDLFRADEQFAKTLSQTVFDSTLYTIYSAPVGLTLRFIGFSLDNDSECAQNKELRQAISEALGRNDLLPEPCIFSPTPAHSLAPGFFLKSARPSQRYNPANAAALFKRYRRQLLASPLLLCSNVDASDVIKAHSILTDLGLPVKLNIHKNRYFNYIINERPDMFRAAFIAGFPDPEDYYGLFYSKSGRDVNLTRYSNPQFDKIFEQSMIEQNPDNRIQQLLELENILREDVPAIFMSHSHPTSYLTPATVHGFSLYFLFPDLRKIYVERDNAGKE